MSNLNPAVAFDVLRGWPNGAAIDDSFPVTATKTVLEGQFCSLLANGTVSSIAPAVTNSYRLCIQGSDQYDVKFVGKVVVLRGHVTIKTEKYTGAVVVGGPVMVGADGYLLPGVPATAPTVGIVEEIDAANKVIIVALSL